MKTIMVIIFKDFSNDLLKLNEESLQIFQEWLDSEFKVQEYIHPSGEERELNKDEIISIHLIPEDEWDKSIVYLNE